MTHHHELDPAELAAWDQTHAQGVVWLDNLTKGMWHVVRHKGPALACGELYDELVRLDERLDKDSLRKAVALAITELARRDLTVRGVRL